MATQPGDLAPLQAIASAFSAGQISLWEAAGEVLQTLMDRLQCSRVSLWGFELEGGQRALRCVLFKRAHEDLKCDATLLREDQYRDYFAALIRTGVFVTDDMRREPALAAMRTPFLDANHIGALLDVAVTINGRAYGIVCCEQIPGPRHWLPEDIAAARAAVSRAALLIASEPSVAFDEIASVAIRPLDAPAEPESADSANAARAANSPAGTAHLHERRARRKPAA